MPLPPEKPSNQPPSRSNRGAVLLGVVVLLAVVTVAAAAIVYEVGLSLGGPIAAVVGVVSLFATPLGIGVVIERASSKMRRDLRAERVALYVTPIYALTLVVIAFTSMRATTATALATVSDRHDWATGMPGQWAHRLGEALSPNASGTPQPRASASGDLPAPSSSTSSV